MCAATALTYCSSTSVNAAGGVAFSGRTKRTTPTAPTTPVDVRSGVIITARAVPDGEAMNCASGSTRMFSLMNASPEVTTRPVALASRGRTMPSISTDWPTVAATRSESPSELRSATYAPWASTRLVRLWSV